MRRIGQWRTILIASICFCVLLPFHSLTKSKRHLQSSVQQLLKQDKARFSTRGRHSNTTAIQSLRNDSYKPFFVLHIGPVKTGTTTLQCALQRLSQDLLHLDNYLVVETESCRPELPLNETNLSFTKGGVATFDIVVLGKAFAPNCLSRWNSSENGMPSCWKDSYVKFAKYHAQQNHSIIVSNEILSQVTSKVDAEFVSDLVESLKDFRVVIVATYRPWFEWVVSLHDQVTKPLLNKKRDWPETGQRDSKKLEPLQNFMGRQLRHHRRHIIPKASFPFVDDGIEVFHNDSRIQLDILNIHVEGDLVTNFVCKALHGATHMCNSLKKHLDTTVVDDDKNKATHKHWYDILAVHAHEQGLTSRPRLATLKRIQEFQESTLGKSSTDFQKHVLPRAF